MPNLPDDPTLNVALWNDAENKTATFTTDGAKERLDVAASIEGGSFQLQPFTPNFDFSVAGTSLNTSTDTSLFLETGHAGKIDFISIAGSLSTWEVVIKVDAVEILRITMAELGSSLGLSNATNVPLWVETANKNFRFSPDEGVDFTDSFEVLAKATTGSPTVNWLVNHRDAA
jgi:hypothetical protein